MARPELGTKRVCPETGRKFYDLNRDPIVSPYTGKTYPLSAFEDTKMKAAVEEEEEADDEVEAADAPELVSLEDADSADSPADDNLPDIDEGDDDVDLGEDEDDAFLPDEEDEDEDDVSGIIGGVNGDDEEV